jgi:hypothetical protein
MQNFCCTGIKIEVKKVKNKLRAEKKKRALQVYGLIVNSVCN